MGGQVLVRKMDGGQVRRFRTGSMGKGYLETHVYCVCNRCPHLPDSDNPVLHTCLFFCFHDLTHAFSFLD